MVDDIVHELKQEDYEEASGEDTNTSDDDFTTSVLSGAEEPQVTPPVDVDSEDYEVDVILDKISKRGMESLTPGEVSFLKSLGG